jgi:Amt family ammonium transporter
LKAANRVEDQCRGGHRSGLLEGNPGQLLTQLYGVVATAAWCGAATFGLLRLVGWLVPLRASTEDEIAGLDISLHGEALQ